VELGRENALSMHVALVPFIAAAGELKTKPMQHSVKELRSIGIQPDILLCRADRPLPPEERRKIALFTNVRQEAVISAIDVSNIYQIPVLLHEQGLDDLVVGQLHLEAREADVSEWQHVVDLASNPTGSARIALVGKYVNLTESYKSLSEALRHAGIHTRTKIEIDYVDSERIEREGPGMLADCDAILVPGGFGERGIEGKIKAAEFARANRLPYLGICLGMQVAVIEFARNVVGLADAHSTEFNRETTNPVIALITEWQNADGSTEVRTVESDLGGSMRLGGQECRLIAGSRTRELYDSGRITERHRHRYEFNNRYRMALEEKGMVFAGCSADGNLIEVIELKDHPWFIGCQFHPEFTSSPRDGHPLFSGYVLAARAQGEAKRMKRVAAK